MFDTAIDIAVKSHARSLVSRAISKMVRSQILGVISDAETGESVIGASVRIDGTNRGAMTDFDGRYLIERLEAGTYNVVITHLDYLSITVEGVEVRKGEDAEVSRVLSRNTNPSFIEIIVHSE